MSELDFINSVKTIVSNNITNYSTEIISRTPSTASSMNVTLAVLFQNKSIDESLIKDLIDLKINSNRNEIDFETKKELGNLDFEVILVSAEIFYKG